MKFKLGDEVTAIEGAPYSVTDKDAVMEVIEILSEELVRIEIIQHKRTEHTGKSYDLETKYLVKVYKWEEGLTYKNEQPVYWEYRDNEHDKFWAANIIKIKSEFVLVRKWGRIGNAPQTVEQKFDTQDKAERFLSKLIQAKEVKGYKPIF